MLKILFLLLLCAACSREEVSFTEPKPDLLVALNNNPSCWYSGSSGDEVSEYTGAEYELGPFQKIYDSALLNSMLSASTDSILEFSKKVLNLDLYKSYEPGQCTIPEYNKFANLPSAPDLANQFWSERHRELDRGRILGVYFGYEYGSQEFPIYQVNQSKPSLMIRQDTGKWTLIHEILHHLFDEYRFRVTGKNSQQVLDFLNQKLKSYKEAAQNYENNPSQKNAELLANQGIPFAKEIQNLVLQFAFEEIAIERILQEKEREGSLNFVEDSAILNSRAYIRSSYDEGLSIASEFLSPLQKIDPRDLSNQLKNELQEVLDKIEDIKQEAASYLSPVNPRNRGLDEDFDSYIQDEHVHDSSGCSHSGIVSDLIRKWKN